jgi:hypothetical protein
MNWDAIGAVGKILGAIAVFVSLIESLLGLRKVNYKTGGSNSNGTDNRKLSLRQRCV